MPCVFTWQVDFTEAGRFAYEWFRESPVRFSLLLFRLRKETNAAYVYASLFQQWHEKGLDMYIDMYVTYKFSQG